MSEYGKENSALRYITDAGIAEGDSAQNFLKNKLMAGAAGRYTKEQYEELGRNGGLAVVNASDGSIPAGQFYDSQNPTKNQGNGGAAGTIGQVIGFDEGIQSKNQFNAASLKEHFGIESVDEDKAYKKDSSTGTKQTAGLGTYLTEDDYNRLKNDDKVWTAYASLHGQSAMEDKRDGGDMSINTLDALFDDLSKEEKEAVAPVKQEENKPIEHSPEIKQAVQRVRTYENDVMSGKLSNDIFGGAKSYDDYSFDHNKGGTGIGTKGGVVQDSFAKKATQSFLNNKSADVKKEFNFKPA